MLATAVAGIGGAERPGQVAMAEAVRDAIETAEHLAVQAGTGTGKSLAYLVPAVRHAMATDAAVVVSTATIALQRQLVERDLPRLAKALRPSLAREPVFAILKGRRNYLCLHRLQAGAPDDPEQGLFDSRTVTAVGRQVQRLHEWAESTSTGDRDELVPGVDERAWRQVAVSARECLGNRCPLRTQCFAEKARDDAGEADIVVTNHALLAIDAIADFPVLPEHDVVIIDEAHDLVDRVTSVASAELSASMVDTAARRCGRLINGSRAGQGKQPQRGRRAEQGERAGAGKRGKHGGMAGDADVAGVLGTAGEALAAVLAETPGGRLDTLPTALAASLAVVRDTARECATELRLVLGRSEDDTERLGIGRAALTTTEEVHDTAARLLESFGPDLAARREVVWLDRPYADDARRPPALRVAPLDVGAMLADRLFARHTVVLTSATLALGGSFEPLARQWGLPPLGDSSGGAAGRGTTGGQIVPNGSAVGSTSEPDAPPGRTASGNGAHTRLGQAAAGVDAAPAGTAARVDAPPEHDAAGAPAPPTRSATTRVDAPPEHDAAGAPAPPTRSATTRLDAPPEHDAAGAPAPPTRSATTRVDAPPEHDAAGAPAPPTRSATTRVDAPPEHDAADANAARPDGPAEDARATAGASALAWSGIDVGSPFDHPRSGILYVARHLPPPGRDGLPEAYLDELAELIIAAGGRTLGLFSSMRAARQAADELRDRIGHPLLCQGDDATSQLITQFAGDEPTCLFGTLSLWQGVDVPGPSLQLVAIDRIPFPRPDDPLASARQRAVSAHGGNGFMTVAATGAALLLAQGTGRLLRTMTDRGVVAILDPRLVTARYGSFLRASLPPFWTTTDPEVVRGALRRLAASSCA